MHEAKYSHNVHRWSWNPSTFITSALALYHQPDRWVAIIVDSNSSGVIPKQSRQLLKGRSAFSLQQADMNMEKGWKRIYKFDKSFFLHVFLILQGIYHGSTIVPLLCLIIRVPPSSHLEKHHGSRGPIFMVILCFTEGHVYTLYIYIYIQRYIILQNPLFWGLPEKKHVFSK